MRTFTTRRLTKDEYDADDDEDLGPTHLPPVKHHNSNHRLVPYRVLTRFLGSYVGKPWRQAHAVLSDRYDRRTDVGQAVWQHIDREVDEHAFIGADGAVYLHGIGYHDFYVHPTTGILCKTLRKWYRHGYRPPVNPNEKKLDDDRLLLREEGIWFLYTYRMADEGRTTRVRHMNPDPALRKTEFWVWVDVIEWVKVRHLLTKHQLNHKELRHYGLVNTPIVRPIPRRKRAA